MKFGTTYRSLQGPGGMPWTAMGDTGQAADIFGLVDPPDIPAYDWMKEQRDKEQFDMKKNLFGKLFKSLDGFGSGSGSFSYTPPSIPAPNFVSAGPVWSQQQIDAQSNLQRGNLMTQANNQSRDFGLGMASRGFSPFSPFAQFNANNNMMRANAGAASNETNLNFNAAKANSDASLQAAGINAGIYGDYVKALMGQGQMQNEYNLKRMGMQQDLVSQLMRAL